MHIPGYRSRSKRVAMQAILVTTLLCLSCLHAAPVVASFNGPISLSFGFTLAVAAIMALPGGLLCVLAEVFGTRHRPPLWIGFTALVLALGCMLVALRLVGPGGDSGMFIFPVPPLMTLALVTLLRAPSWRLVAMWCVALGGAGLLITSWPQDRSAAAVAETLGVYLGGGLSSMLPWQLAFILQQHARRRAGISSEPAPSLAALGLRLKGLAHPNLPQPIRRLLEHRGLVWWLGSAVTFYVCIFGLAALGSSTLMVTMLMIEWRVMDFFGSADPARYSHTLQAWAGSGLIWAAIVGGGVWGLAASAGRFDPGRAAPLRLAAILLAVVMLLWIATSIVPL